MEQATVVKPEQHILDAIETALDLLPDGEDRLRQYFTERRAVALLLKASLEAARVVVRGQIAGTADRAHTRLWDALDDLDDFSGRLIEREE